MGLSTVFNFCQLYQNPGANIENYARVAAGRNRIEIGCCIARLKCHLHSPLSGFKNRAAHGQGAIRRCAKVFPCDRQIPVVNGLRLNECASLPDVKNVYDYGSETGRRYRPVITLK